MKRELLEKEFNTSKNIIVTGDVSVGKTAKIMFPLVEKMMENNESMLIIDSKEEYINRYYDDFKSKGYNTIILNFRDLDKSDGWNPIEHPYNLYKKGNIDKSLEYVEKLGKTMFYESGSVDPFWSLTSADFFTGVSLGLFEDGKEEEINLNSVNLMFNGIDRKFGTSDYITHYFNSKKPTSQAYMCASTTFLAPKDTKGSILSVARQRLRTYVSREKLSVLMSKTTFNYEEIANKPTVIFVIARDENKYLNTIAAMFVEQLFAILIDLKVSNKFNFVLDNFDIVERYNDLVDMLGSGISRNIKFVIGTRSLEKMLEDYGMYIKKLCNVIALSNDTIEINNEQIANEYEEIENKVSNINYPTLNIKEIKLFDLEKFIQDKKKDDIVKSMENMGVQPKPLDKPSIDVLINKIDDKLAELDAEEKMAKAKENNTSIKSEFSQFKVSE